MYVAMILAVIGGLLGGYYAYKTIASEGKVVHGLTLVTMKLTPVYFFASLIVSVVFVGWKGLLYIPIFYLVSLIVKSILLASYKKKQHIER